MPGPAAEVVDRQVGHHAAPVVAVDEEPRRDVGVLPHRGPTACRAVVVGGAELAHGPAGVNAPVVAQREVQVRVGRPLHGQAFRGPLLPPVPVPLEALIERAHAPVEEPDPGGPGVLTRALEVAEIVDLEPGRAPLPRRLEPRVLARHLAELHLLGVAGEHGARGVVWQAGVRSLVIVHGAALEGANHRRTALHPAPGQERRDLVGPVQEAMPQAQRPRVRVVRQVRRAPRVQAPVHRGDHGADGAVAGAVVLVEPDHRVVRGRLDGLAVHAGHLLRDGVERAEPQASRQAAGELGGAVDRREGRRCRVPVHARERRRAPDAAAVEQALAAAVHGVAVHGHLEHAPAGHEERAPLREERLVGRQVQHAGIRLHLAEVRVDGGVQCQVGRHAVLEVGADGEILIASEVVALDARAVLGDDIRRGLQPPGRLQVVEPGDLGELRDQAGRRLAEQGPGDPLVVAIEVPINGEAERVLALGAVPHLRQRDAELRRPAQRVDAGGHVPHRVPRPVLVAVVVDRGVVTPARGGHAEFEPRAAVVVRVDQQGDAVGLRKIVAAPDKPNDAVGMGIEATDEDVQVGAVVGDARLGGEPGRLALGRLPFLEVRDDLGEPPDRVLVASVDDGGLNGQDRPRRWARGACAIQLVCGLRASGAQHQTDDREQTDHAPLPKRRPRLGLPTEVGWPRCHAPVPHPPPPLRKCGAVAAAIPRGGMAWRHGG